MKRALIFAGGGGRGAFQIGVWKYLVERNWTPDIICGTSVGAVNAVGIGSGLDVSTLIRLWTTHNRRRMYRLNLGPFLSGLLSGRVLKPLLDNRLFQAVVSDHVDFNALKNSRTRVVISAVNVHTARPCFFDNSQIGLEHVLASCAMPILFPWHDIEGVPHWDGGVMTNIPLQPALDFGADEIIIAMMSPIGHTPQAFPITVRTALEHVFEQFLASAYQSTLIARGYRDRPLPLPQLKDETRYHGGDSGEHQPNIITLAPYRMLGFMSLLNFSSSQAGQLIQDGYTIAHTQLKHFI